MICFSDVAVDKFHRLVWVMWPRKRQDFTEPLKKKPQGYSVVFTHKHTLTQTHIQRPWKLEWSSPIHTKNPAAEFWFEINSIYFWKLIYWFLINQITWHKTFKSFYLCRQKKKIHGRTHPWHFCSEISPVIRLPWPPPTPPAPPLSFLPICLLSTPRPSGHTPAVIRFHGENGEKRSICAAANYAGGSTLDPRN